MYDDLEPSEKVKVYDRGVIITDNPDEVHKLAASNSAPIYYCACRSRNGSMKPFSISVRHSQ